MASVGGRSLRATLTEIKLPGAALVLPPGAASGFFVRWRGGYYC